MGLCQSGRAWLICVVTVAWLCLCTCFLDSELQSASDPGCLPVLCCRAWLPALCAAGHAGIISARNLATLLSGRPFSLKAMGMLAH